MKEKSYVLNKSVLTVVFLTAVLLYSFYDGILGNMVFGLLTLLIVSSISVYIHEAGHYFAARIFGFNPQYFIVGTKQVILNKINGLFKFKLFGTNFILNPLGHAGSVEAFTYMFKSDKLKMALVCAAGPLSNLAFALFVFWINSDFLLMQYSKGIDGFFDIFSRASYESYLLAILLMIFFINIGNFVFNLIPFIKGVDGWFILQLLKTKKHPEFSNINIHKDMEKSMVDTDSFSRTIEPIYNKFSDK